MLDAALGVKPPPPAVVETITFLERKIESFALDGEKILLPDGVEDDRGCGDRVALKEIADELRVLVGVFTELVVE